MCGMNNRSGIVTLAGWVFAICAVLAIVQLRMLQPGAELWVAAANAVLLFAIGVGLLLRHKWARWLSLGMSLLAWTLGSLLTLWGIAMMLKLSVVVAVVMAVILGLFILLNFRLFERLNSDEGRAEFDTPDEEKGAVVKSAAACVAWSVIGAVAGQPAHLESRLETRMVLPDPAAQSAAPPQPLAEEGALPESLAPAADATREREAQFTEWQREADERRARIRQNAANRANGTARAESTQQSETDAATSTSQILRCRDASGAISFTQGHCPEGTTRVDSPGAE
jgi:hypothetical protein